MDCLSFAPSGPSAAQTPDGLTAKIIETYDEIRGSFGSGRWRSVRLLLCQRAMAPKNATAPIVGFLSHIPFGTCDPNPEAVYFPDGDQYWGDDQAASDNRTFRGDEFGCRTFSGIAAAAIQTAYPTFQSSDRRLQDLVGRLRELHPIWLL